MKVDDLAVPVESVFGGSVTLPKVSAIEPEELLVTLADIVAAAGEYELHEDIYAGLNNLLSATSY